MSIAAGPKLSPIHRTGSEATTPPRSALQIWSYPRPTLQIWSYRMPKAGTLPLNVADLELHGAEIHRARQNWSYRHRPALRVQQIWSYA